VVLSPYIELWNLAFQNAVSKTDWINKEIADISMDLFFILRFLALSARKLGQLKHFSSSWGSAWNSSAVFQDKSVVFMWNSAS
jgi:hypothetical protein